MIPLEIEVDDYKSAFRWLVRKCQAAHWRAFKRRLPVKATDVPTTGHLLVRLKQEMPLTWKARRYDGPGRVRLNDRTEIYPGDITIEMGDHRVVLRPGDFERDYEKAEG